MIIELRCPVCGRLHPWRGARLIRRCPECRAKTLAKIDEILFLSDKGMEAAEKFARAYVSEV